MCYAIVFCKEAKKSSHCEQRDSHVFHKLDTSWSTLLDGRVAKRHTFYIFFFHMGLFQSFIIEMHRCLVNRRELFNTSNIRERITCKILEKTHAVQRSSDRFYRFRSASYLECIPVCTDIFRDHRIGSDQYRYLQGCMLKTISANDRMCHSRLASRRPEDLKRQLSWGSNQARKFCDRQNWRRGGWQEARLSARPKTEWARYD